MCKAFFIFKEKNRESKRIVKDCITSNNVDVKLPSYSGQNNDFIMMYWNAQSIFNKINELESMILFYKIDIICITEHWLRDDVIHNFHMSGYVMANYFCRKHSSHGGVLILVKQDLQFKTLNNLNELSIETVCEVAAVSIDKYNLVVLTIYRTPNASNFNQFFDTLHDLILRLDTKREKYSILICGDFNVNFLQSGTNNFKDILYNFFSSFGLRLLINEITRRKSGTCIDNVVTSLHSDRVSAKVIPMVGSDHDAIMVDCRINKSHNVLPESTKPKFRPLSASGTANFCYLLSKINWISLYAMSGIEDMFVYF